MLDDNKENNKVYAVANCILEKIEKMNVHDVTNLKLQKLLYFANGIHLSLYDVPLFSNKIYAWKLGPVVKDVYYRLNSYGNNVITARLRTINSDTSKDIIIRYDDFTEEEEKSIIITCLAYGNKKANKLVEITHQDNTAWKKVYQKDKKDILIDQEDIKKEFNNYLSLLKNYLFS
jgi:uncharacterized phage-associated protein